MIDLVLIYNHKYESNIPKLERYYSGKFRKIWHLVPFYTGTAENVIPVYEGSFFFQGFIAQAARRLLVDPPEQFFFVSDDLLLDPAINQTNVLHEFGLKEDWGFIAELHDLSQGRYGRGVTEARKASLKQFGLEIDGELPSFAEAQEKIARHIKLDSLVLRRYTPYIRAMEKPYGKNLHSNWKKFRGNLWHLREQFRHWTHPKTLSYPLLGGYSDLFIIPSSVFGQFAHYCGVLAAARVFVELAIPTALAFVCPHLVTEETCPRRGLNVWFPPGPWAEMERKTALLDGITAKAQNKLPNLIADWPQDYLYVHPLKLSKWSW